jgi:hypothetical protein
MSGFKKFDAGKPKLSTLTHIPTASLVEEARAFEYGGEKYGWDNFRKGTNHTRYADAALRHIFEYLRGVDADPESGLSPLIHAIASLRIVRELQIAGAGTDDRTDYGAAPAPADEDYTVVYATRGPCPESSRGDVDHCFDCLPGGECCFCGGVEG